MGDPAVILFLTGRLRGGGSESVLLSHALNMDRSRFQPEILAVEPETPNRETYLAAGIPVHGPREGKGALARVAGFRRRLRSLCDTGRVAIVHAWITDTALFGPQAVGRRSGCRVLVSQRNLGYWLTPVRRRVYRWSNRRYVHRMIVNADAVRKQVVKDRLCPDEKIVVVPNGIDLQRFRPRDRREARERLGLDPDRLTVGMVGTLKAIKGQDDLLGALEILGARDVRPQVVLVGAGPDRKRLEERVRAGGLAGQVRFLGRREDVETIYPAFDVCVLCSRTEGFPNVLLEAMACGCAAVSTPVGGVPEAMVDGENGLRYPVGDEEALSEHLARLLGDGTAARALGDGARRTVEARFAFERMQKELEALYASSIEESR